MNQQFFQAFFGPQGPQNIQNEQQTPEYILHNEIVLEIVNNWELVNTLIKKYKEGNLKQVDNIEHVWYSFIVSKNIDIALYQNEEEFINQHWKIPVN